MIAAGTPGAARGWTALPRLLRFFVVGGINTVFGYVAYASLLYAGLHYAWAVLLGTIAGVIFNFFTTGGLVFDGVDRARFARFVGVYVGLYGINVGLLALVQRLCEGTVLAGPYRAGLVLIVPMALVSFMIMRRFVFGGERAAD